jgi:hypothetical protein
VVSALNVVFSRTLSGRTIPAPIFSVDSPGELNHTRPVQRHLSTC